MKPGVLAYQPRGYLGKRLFARGGQLLLLGGVGLLLAYLVVTPLVLLLVSGFKPTGLPSDTGFTFQHYLATYGDPGTYALLWNSLVFSAGTVVLTSFLALSFAWLLERTDTPAKGFLRALIIIPMANPPIMLAISWVLLLSPQIGFLNHLLMALFRLENAPFNIYSMPGMVFVQSLALVPSAFLIFSPAFRNMDPSLEEAALVSGAGVPAMLRRIVLPILLPALLAASAFIFIVGLVVFDIPGVLGLPVRILVFSSQVYFAARPPAGLPQFGAIAAMASVFLVIMFAASYVYLRMIRQGQKFATITGKGYRPRMLPLGRLKYVSLAYVLLYFFLSVFAPLAMLAWTSFLRYYSAVSAAQLNLLTLENYGALLQHPKVIQAAVNTFIVAVVSATAVAFLSALVSWIVVRSRLKGARVLDVLAFLPVAIPAIMTGLALIYVYLTLRFIPIYGTVWIIAIAYITVYISFGTRTTNGVLLQIHRELEEAAQMSGASWLRTFTKITLPLMMPALLAVWIWVAAHAMRELSAALMLASGANVVLSTLLWSFWEGGLVTAAAAVGVALTVALIIMVALLQVLSRRGRGALEF